jgi:hypothetical protein
MVVSTVLPGRSLACRAGSACRAVLAAGATAPTGGPRWPASPPRPHPQLPILRTDPGLSGTGEWLVTRTPSGVTIQRGHGKADVAVRGPAASLLLVLTRRLPPSDPAIEILGQQALLTHLLQHTPF